MTVAGNDGLALWEEGQYHGATISQDLWRQGRPAFDLREIDRAWAVTRRAVKPLLLVTSSQSVVTVARAQVDNPSGPTIAIHDPRPQAVLNLALSRC
jgi:hypothetical protein